MIDVLLIQPPIRDFYLTIKRTIPYGLSRIAAALILRGFDTEIIDALATKKSRILPRPEKMACLEPYMGKPDTSPFALFHHFRHYGYSFEHIGNRIKAADAFLVGISSLFTPYFNEALKTAEIAKQMIPSCRVVLGGHHPTACPESVLRHEAVDFVIRGDGEAALPLLAESLKQQTPLENIPGIGFRTDHGRVHINEPAYMEHPEDVPLPADHLVNHRYYRRNGKKSIMISASTGCPMTCAYCCMGKNAGVPFRRRSVSSVIAEIDRAAQFGDLGFVDFEDENLSNDKAWFLKLLNEIAVRFTPRHIEFRAMNGLFPPSLEEATVAAMKAAGFSALNLSLCTSQKEQLHRFSRPDVSRAFTDALKWAEEHDMEAVGYIIAGAPHQTARSSLRDLLFLAKHRVLAGLSIYYPAPGSRTFEECRQQGVLPEDHILMRSSVFPVSHTTKRIESVTLMRLSRILNFIKHLIDSGEGLPIPEPADPAAANPGSRLEMGRKLLSWFLHDGKIRGVTPEGEVYEHLICPGLAWNFIEGITSIRVRGSKERSVYR